MLPLTIRPCVPPSPDEKPQPPRLPAAPTCYCETHSYSPREEQYKQLLEKEAKLFRDYDQLRKLIVDVRNDILDHPCDDPDIKTMNIYNAICKLKSIPPKEYRKLGPDQQSPAPIPTEPHRLGFLERYKDPTIKDLPTKPITVRSTIHPPPEIHTGVSPIAVTAWFVDNPGRTEYMDAYSARAKATLRSMKRYKEPLPSSRMRADDCVV